MFSIQRIPIPSARLNAKGKIIEPVTIHTVSIVLMDSNNRLLKLAMLS